MNLHLLEHVTSSVTHHTLKLRNHDRNARLQEMTIHNGTLQDAKTKDRFPIVEGVDELKELVLKIGLYAGMDETTQICIQDGLMLDEQFEVSPENSHERVISVFKKVKG